MFRPYLAIFRSICYLQLTVEKRKHITYAYLRVLYICVVERDLVEQHKYSIPLNKHMLYVFSSPLLIVDSTAETCRHRRNNKLRYLVMF